MEKTLAQRPSTCLKIVCYGPESSGKSTLARELAAHYNTLWVPEYAREYLQRKWDFEKKTCERHDLVPIARGQIKLENEAAQNVRDLLICDTDLLETKVYSEAYYKGWCDARLEEAALANTYDLYLLTSIDVPWEADDLRDRPEDREKMYALFEKALLKYDRPYIKIAGTLEERMKIATNHIKTLSH